jgi:hypothetical protein
MPKIPGVNHLRAVGAFEKAGFKIVRQGKHIVMSDGAHFITTPRHNPVNALTDGRNREGCGSIRRAIPRVTVTAELEARSSERGLPGAFRRSYRVRDYLSGSAISL